LSDASNVSRYTGPIANHDDIFNTSSASFFHHTIFCTRTTPQNARSINYVSSTISLPTLHNFHYWCWYSN